MFSPVMQRVLNGFLREYPGLMTCTMLSTLITFILESVVTPRLLGSTFTHLSSAPELRANLVKLVLAWISSQLGNGWSEYCFAKVDVALCNYLRKKIFHQLFLKYEQDHQDIPTAKLMDIVEMLQATMESLLYRVLSVFPRFVIIIIILVNLCSINMTLGLYTSFILLVFFIVMVVHYQTKTSLTHPSLNAKADLLDYTNDVFINMERVSSVHGAMRKEEEKCHQFNDMYLGQKWETSRVVLKDQYMNYAINIVIFSFILYKLFQTYQAKQMTNEQVVTFVLSISPLFVNMYEIIYYMPEFTRYFGIMSYHTNFMTDLFSYQEPLGKEIELHTNTITLDQLSYAYGENTILNQVSLTIPSGSFVTLRGPSGIGKSTLFKLLCRNLTPSFGSIKVDGHDISEWSIPCLRKHILCLTQHATLFHDTVYHNMIYGEEDTPDLRHKVETLLRDHQWTSLFPDTNEFASLDAKVGHLGKNLSGGQRQLVHLIRCFLCSSPILLLDEPTSAIDAINTHEVMAFLRRIHQQGKTILLISHEATVFSDTVLEFPAMTLTSL